MPTVKSFGGRPTTTHCIVQKSVVPGANIHRAGAGGAAHPDGGERAEAHRGFQDLEDVAGGQWALGGPLGRFMEIPLSPQAGQELFQGYLALASGCPALGLHHSVSSRILGGSVGTAL